MSRLVETIKIVNGNPINLFWHQKRLEMSFINFYKSVLPFDLEEHIIVPEEFKAGITKLRFIYDDHNFTAEYSRYFPKPLTSLKIVEDDKVNYSFKFFDRTCFEYLQQKKGTCDDILIIKKGLVTDVSYANIVFQDDKNWYTPSKPLLNGTCRQRLLSEAKISEMLIKSEDLSKFSSFRIVNAMIDFENQKPIDISNIYF
jgi:4-amino-4-deoxychorismate lyase